MVTCYDCLGKGYTLFLGNESTCRHCTGSGKLVACTQYSLDPTKTIAFRNQPCHHCGVKPADHIYSGALNEIS